MQPIHISQLKERMVVVEGGSVFICAGDAYRVNNPLRVGWECWVVDTDCVPFDNGCPNITELFEADENHGLGLNIYRVK